MTLTHEGNEIILTREKRDDLIFLSVNPEQVPASMDFLTSKIGNATLHMP
ncbi:MAG: hypothetical protein K6G64_02230 [Eubacterium sp.]|nr:hypothetical protein [Eubacterium sp.]